MNQKVLWRLISTSLLSVAKTLTKCQEKECLPKFLGPRAAGFVDLGDRRFRSKLPTKSHRVDRQIRIARSFDAGGSASPAVPDRKARDFGRNWYRGLSVCERRSCQPLIKECRPPYRPKQVIWKSDIGYIVQSMRKTTQKDVCLQE